MPKYADFLVEIHTEELPPKSLLALANAFLKEITDRLRKADLPFAEAQFYATPRRLAVSIKNLADRQNDSVIERKGPALHAAFDKEGKPTPACIGFAKSINIPPEKLIKIKSHQGIWVGFKQKMAGKSVNELMPLFVQQALAALPIPKRMRWGNNTNEFVRPVHSVIMLYNDRVITSEILGYKSGRRTRGHRFLSKNWVDIKKTYSYSDTLYKAFVIADFDKRKTTILKQIEALIKHLPKNARALISDSLLNEVTAMVEWPITISGSFDKKFLTIPQEVLISAMQDHQRYFPVVDGKGKLLPHFITVSNIASKDPKRVITGNQRVLRARLSDASFFYEQDKKLKLEDRIEKLKHVVFQAKLGSLFDKAKRLAGLMSYLSKEMKLSLPVANRLGLLAKTDLTTELVKEFPELQGIAGSYYAINDKEPEAIVKALNEQYLPRFSGDALPNSVLGCAIAIADRIDILVSVFGTNQQPTSDKDPFGARRAAMGIIRILVEKKLNLDLGELIEFSLKHFSVKLENKNVVNDVLTFMLERLKPWYQDQQIPIDIINAVTAVKSAKPYDIHCRIQAVQSFKKMKEAESLSIANKRVSNILSKYDNKITAREVNDKLFEHDAEKVLATKLKEQQQLIQSLSKSAQYQQVLSHLAHLRKPVDDFFDHVLVMTEDKERRENRLLLLKQLRDLFLNVADIALLQ